MLDTRPRMGYNKGKEMKETITTKVAAKKLGVTERTIINWLRSKTLRGARTNPRAKRSLWQVSEQDTERLLKERAAQLAL